MDRRRRERVSVSRGMLPLLALHAVTEYCRLERKPPVTAALVAANTVIYLRPKLLDHIIPHIDEVWFNPHLILKYKDLKRFLLSVFYHINEPHLVYNMLSLLWKGIQLETSMGSAEFASMVVVLVPISQGITLLLAKSLSLFFDYDSPYYREYSVGFSGVLFALKVILNAQSGEYAYVQGLMVPARYAAWAELILIQMLVPGVSFLGHLGGILAGLVYLRLKRSYSGSNPLIKIIRGLVSAVTWPLKFLRGQRRVYGQGAVGGRWPRNTYEVWRCPSCTFDNSSALNFCEMCGTSRSEEYSSHPTMRRIDDIPLEELRRRRVERFGGL